MASEFDELTVFADELMANGDARGEVLARLLAHGDSRQPVAVPIEIAASRDADLELDIALEGGRVIALSFCDLRTERAERFVTVASQLVRLPATRFARALQFDAGRPEQNLAVLASLGQADIAIRPELLIVGPAPRKVHAYATPNLAAVNWWRSPTSGVRSMFVCSARAHPRDVGAPPIVRRVLLEWSDRARPDRPAAFEQLALEFSQQTEPSLELRTRLLRAVWELDPNVRRQAVALGLARGLPAPLASELRVPHSFRADTFELSRQLRRELEAAIKTATPDPLYAWTRRRFEHRS